MGVQLLIWPINEKHFDYFQRGNTHHDIFSKETLVEQIVMLWIPFQQLSTRYYRANPNSRRHTLIAEMVIRDRQRPNERSSTRPDRDRWSLKMGL